MKRYDVVVVGAGPAGSTAAYRLASAGASVLLLDRARFPRDKPCGGGLTGRALRLLPFSVDPVVEDAVDRFEFRLRYGARFERRSAAPIVWMTQRRRLDALLAEHAVEAGAEFRDGARVTGVAADGGVSVQIGRERVAASTLVGADGVNGVTARALGLAGRYRYGVALEGNAPYDVRAAARHRGRATVELAILPGGYGWIFPKGDHANVGVGGWEEHGPRLRGALARLCAAHGFTPEALHDVRGYRLPLRRRGDPAARARALVVGDAAGLVDPLSGDGIYEALLSAKLAAGAILDLLAGRASALDPYTSALEQRLAAQISTSWAAKQAFDRFPRLAFALARAPLVWGFVEGLIGGDVREPSEAKGLVRAPLKAMEALGSVRAASG